MPCLSVLALLIFLQIFNTCPGLDLSEEELTTYDLAGLEVRAF